MAGTTNGKAKKPLLRKREEMTVIGIERGEGKSVAQQMPVFHIFRGSRYQSLSGDFCKAASYAREYRPSRLPRPESEEAARGTRRTRHTPFIS